MNVRRLTLGALDTNCWLADDGAGGPVVIVDPADDPTGILEALNGQTVAVIVLTHGHFDHLAAVSALVEQTGAPLLIHLADAERITSAAKSGGAMFGFYHVAPKADRLLEDGDVIEAGSVSLVVLHTPGHTEGSICLEGGGHLFSGDTLFSGSVGRTDFPGGDARVMQGSIARLASLPDETLVHPGHGPDTTIGRERKVNPFFPRA